MAVLKPYYGLINALFRPYYGPDEAPITPDYGFIEALIWPYYGPRDGGWVNFELHNPNC